MLPRPSLGGRDDLGAAARQLGDLAQFVLVPLVADAPRLDLPAHLVDLLRDLVDAADRLVTLLLAVAQQEDAADRLGALPEGWKRQFQAAPHRGGPLGLSARPRAVLGAAHVAWMSVACVGSISSRA